MVDPNMYVFQAVPTVRRIQIPLWSIPTINANQFVNMPLYSDSSMVDPNSKRNGLVIPFLTGIFINFASNRRLCRNHFR